MIRPGEKHGESHATYSFCHAADDEWMQGFSKAQDEFLSPILCSPGLLI